MKQNSLWFAIIDGGHARFVSAESNDSMGTPKFVRNAGDSGFRHPPAIRTQCAMSSIVAGKPARNLRSDRPGRAFESASPTRHAIQSKTDPREIERARFIELVAERLHDFDRQFDGVVVVAQPVTAKLFARALNGSAKRKIVGTLYKNLSNVPDHELLPHLREWLR